jgi:hypothetical protein
MGYLSAVVEKTAKVMPDSDFWELCEFVLDRLDEARTSVAGQLAATERTIVSHQMNKVAAMPDDDTATEAAAYNLLRAMARPYSAHPGFRSVWAAPPTVDGPQQASGGNA